MLEKSDVIFFKEKNCIVFLKNKFVHNGIINHVGNSCLIINDKIKGMMTINYSDIQEIKENVRE
jgi:hypothetical protein